MVDAQLERARRHGARVLQEPIEYEYGEVEAFWARRTRRPRRAVDLDEVVPGLAAADGGAARLPG